jgi:hypothetical protein
MTKATAFSALLLSAMLGLSPLGAAAQFSAVPSPSAEELAQQAQKEREKQDREEAARQAAAERAAQAKAEREALQAKCVIKPVMTDAEIEYCRQAYR